MTHRAIVEVFDPASTRNCIFLSRSLSLSLILRPTVSRPVCLGIKHPYGAYDQIFITVRQLRVCSCRALSLTRGRVCRLQLLLVLASAVILGSESRGTRDQILLNQFRDFPFRRLLRLAGLQWRYSIPPPHGILLTPLHLSRCIFCIFLSLSLKLRPTVSRPVCLGIKHPSGAYDVRVRVTLRLAVYHQLVCLGAKPLEVHDHSFLSSSSFATK
jgi:hypothetical protein